MRKSIGFVFFLIFFNLSSYASHMMGGEITWDCLGNGQYKFTMKLYRDCNGITMPAAINLSVANHPTVSTITLNLSKSNEISPKCNAIGPAIRCADVAPGVNITGAAEEYIYTSSPINLPGVPPANGWIFYLTNNIRSSGLDNLLQSANNSTLRAVMYSYNGKSADPCFDSSPKFLESPKLIICSGNPFAYNHNAIDADLDSLAFSWSQPLDVYDNTLGAFNPPVNPPPLVFKPPFSYTNPLPDASVDPLNKAAQVNPITGEITFESHTSGSFLTAVKVEAWKCGQLVAEVYREIQVVLLPCGNNTPPTVTVSAFNKTVQAGSLVTFNLNGTDPELLSNGNPQTIEITASGIQFDTLFTRSNAGCSNPPCATLNPPPPVSSSANVATTFSWQTDCNHVRSFTKGGGCNARSNTYNFVIKTQDDFCPAPAINITTISITVVGSTTAPSPKPLCVAVQPNGDVQLTWQKVNDPTGSFNSYHVFASNSLNGPYTDVDSVFNINTTTATHVGANAHAASVYYYIQTRSGCKGIVFEPAVDTVRSIKLTVNNIGNKIAQLMWNAIGTPNIATSTGIYTIYREYPAGTWTPIGTTTSTTFNDTVDICNKSGATINYRVEIADQSGCNSISSIDGGVFMDNNAPQYPPVIDTLSVDANGNVHISWNKNSATDVVGYVIDKKINGIWLPIDTVFGYNNTYYYNSGFSNAGNVSEEYRMVAYDSCNNSTYLGTICNTIFLTAQVDVCALSCKLSWNAYSNLSPTANGYYIYASMNGGTFSLVGTVNSSQTTFTHTGLTQGANYCYYVSVFDAGVTKTASSNHTCVTVNTPKQPLFSYLRVATVAGKNAVDIRCHVDNSVTVKQYKIMRSDSKYGPYITIGTVAPPTASNLISFTDLSAQTKKQTYFYKVVVEDSCGFDGLTTDTSQTMFLTATANDNFTNTLTWNDYELWLGAVNSYNIYRGIDGAFNSTPIANIPYAAAGTNIFTDDISPVMQGQGSFSYYVEALEGAGNIYGFAETSFSNIAEALQDPTFFIPNAFIPDGINKKFTPGETFINTTEYSLTIFNRWGEVVFDTTDPAMGWDGITSGKQAPGGVYIYLIKYKGSDGKYYDRKGSVTLIR